MRDKSAPADVVHIGLCFEFFGGFKCNWTETGGGRKYGTLASVAGTAAHTHWVGNGFSIPVAMNRIWLLVTTCAVEMQSNRTYKAVKRATSISFLVSYTELPPANTHISHMFTPTDYLYEQSYSSICECLQESANILPSQIMAD